MSLDQTASAAAGRVRELLERLALEIGIDATVSVREDEDTIAAEFHGDDVSSAIGDRGETIDAIQHLAHRIAFRGERERKGVVVDAAGYRERRAVTLRSAADRATRAALRDHRPVALDPMNALERKLVHEHLKTRRDIETYSEGQEPSRRLVVAPIVE